MYFWPILIIWMVGIFLTFSSALFLFKMKLRRLDIKFMDNFISRDSDDFFPATCFFSFIWPVALTGVLVVLILYGCYLSMGKILDWAIDKMVGEKPKEKRKGASL